MGAGDGCGPQRRGQAGQVGSEILREQQLRHEHAVDEQRVRHRHVAERGLNRATGRKISPTLTRPRWLRARGGVLHCASMSRARATYSPTGTSSARR
jgi:hypothetical protein